MYRICHMTSAHKSTDVRIFVKECVSLAKAGYEVKLVAFGESRTEKGVSVIGLGERPNKRLERMSRGAKEVYRAADKLDCDVYHIHDPELLPYASKLKKKGKIVIFDSHEFYVDQIKTKEYIPHLIAQLISSCFKVYQKIVFNNIDAAIIPCLVNGKNPFNGYKCDSTIVMNLPLLSEFYDNFKEGEDVYPNSVCYTGVIDINRGIKNVIKSVYAAKCILYLAGPISNNFAEEIEQMTEYECVRYLGVLSREKVIELMRH